MFPPDYRLFMRTLHTPDPEMIGARWSRSSTLPSTDNDVLQATVGRQFPDWTGDPSRLIRSMEWPVDGLIWSIELDESWHPAWGRRPASADDRANVVRSLVRQGPQLIPVCGHRYLVGPGDRIGNPVLSIYGSDVIVYATDLETYLPIEMGLQPWTEPETNPIPFWDNVIAGLPRI